MSISLEDIKAAHARISDHVENTPFRYSQTLSHICGAHIRVKFENLQFTASFKERGALNKLLTLSDGERQAGVIAMSAGNHAQGVAYHAQRLSIPTKIVMPRGTPFVKIEHTRGFGAEVILHGENLSEASDYAWQVCKEEGLTFIHPFDDPEIIAGQGTVALEMLQVYDKLDTIIVPVGGGGLISGIATVAKTLKPDIEMIAVETAQYPSLHAELRGETPKIGGSTIAEGIAVKRVGRLTLDICRKLVDQVLLVDESHIEQAITLFANVEKTVSEGAGATGLAALLAHKEKFIGKRVGLVLCGGNIDPRLLSAVLTRALVREKRLCTIRIIGSDRPGFLASVSQIIGDLGANIIEVAHNRMALDVPVKGAEFDITVETRDEQHTNEVFQALSTDGHNPRFIT